MGKFFGGTMTETYNDRVDPYLQMLQGVYDDYGRKSKGEKMVNEWLKMIRQGRIGELPQMHAFDQLYATQMEDAERNQDAFLPPELAGSKVAQQKREAGRDMGGNVERLASSISAQLPGMSHGMRSDRLAGRSQAAQAGGNLVSGATQFNQEAGYGQFMMDAIMGVGSAIATGGASSAVGGAAGAFSPAMAQASMSSLPF